MADFRAPAALLDHFELPTRQLPGMLIGQEPSEGEGESIAVTTPADGSTMAELKMATPQQAEQAIDAASEAFKRWRAMPAPQRGEIVRRLGEVLREHKQPLGELVSWECGKILPEALGEVQEMIDVCDFAVGLSRQLYGFSMGSERPGHRLTEYWHPLGPVGVISAFNFPVAVWAWNATLALVCGDTIVWKPSEKTPLTALACHRLLMKAIDGTDAPAAISSVVIGAREVGQTLAASTKLPLVSATGSVPMGRAVAQAVGARLGRSLLELGGNNGMIVTPSAELSLAIRAITFAAVGTAGQRCTSLRRLIVHESIADKLVSDLKTVYANLPLGHPLADGTLVGPLIDEAAGDAMAKALEAARSAGGTVTGGERVTSKLRGEPAGGVYVQPAIVEGLTIDADIVQHETFAPILYVLPYRDREEAIAIHNGVPQGLSSAIFTRDVQDAEWFVSPVGSDCGIANVNIGTSGAEIGGAFGGEKDTGGGRESGSDAWKAYMRRMTTTVNYSDALPLAQGIEFPV